MKRCGLSLLNRGEADEVQCWHPTSGRKEIPSTCPKPTEKNQVSNLASQGAIVAGSRGGRWQDKTQWVSDIIKLAAAQAGSLSNLPSS